MFFKTYHTVFLMMLMMGTTISISSNSWFTVWLGLEINLMSMIPLILIKLTASLTDSSIKYFLAQAMASILMIFSIAVIFFINNTISLEMMEVMIISSLAMKLGAAPFHFWFPQVTMGLNWIQNILILTWQKIAPFFVIMSLTSKYLLILSSVSALVGALGGFNQLIMKLIMTYSSISHTGWMISSCILSNQYWISYFFMYSLMSITIILFFYSNSIKKINQIFTSSDQTLSKYITIMNILSLGGLPPLMGFMAKLSIILILIKKKMFILFMFLISASLISLFFYTRIIYSSMMNFNPKFKSENSNSKSNTIMYFFSCVVNIFTPLVFFLT